MNHKILRQYVVPHHLFSRLMGWFTTRTFAWLKNWQIRTFIKTYHVEMSEAEHATPENYVNFTHFFTRHLKAGARPLAGSENDVISPADSRIAQMGDIEGDRLIQAKGHSFSVDELLGGDADLAGEFQDGSFSTLYLAPADYHRVHMPIKGRLTKMIYVPGKLFSVNLHTADHVPKLFARNERVVCIFETERGPMAMVLVGAMFVASICTTWAGVVTPGAKKAITVENYESGAPIILNRGDEMGYFNFGSTVILLFGKDKINWTDNYGLGDHILMGQSLESVQKC